MVRVVYGSVRSVLRRRHGVTERGHAVVVVMMVVVVRVAKAAPRVVVVAVVLVLIHMEYVCILRKYFKFRL